MGVSRLREACSSFIKSGREDKQGVQAVSRQCVRPWIGAQCTSQGCVVRGAVWQGQPHGVAPPD